jgi:hypothetical protein
MPQPRPASSSSVHKNQKLHSNVPKPTHEKIPTLDFHEKNVNLTFHGPLTESKVEKWTGYEIELMEAFSEFNINDSQAYQNMWILPTPKLYPQSTVHVSKAFTPNSTSVSRAVSPTNGRMSVMNAYIVPDASSCVEEAAAKSLQIRQEKQMKLKKFRSELKQRLQKRAETKKQAIKEVLDHYYDTVPKMISKTEPQMAKALSNEDLLLSDLPAVSERNYFVFPEEKDQALHFHRKYFFENESLPEDPLPCKFEVAEKKLRTIFRSGHLEELKKNQYGKVYLNVKKHFADIERRKSQKLAKAKVDIHLEKDQQKNTKESKNGVMVIRVN